MRKNFTLLLVMVLFSGMASFGQATATLGTSLAFPGDMVQVPLNVTNFNSIGSIAFFISYNSDILDFTGYSTVNPAFPGLMANAANNSVNITWFSSSPGTLSSGLLVNLNFKYKGMTSTPLSFLGTCEVYQLQPGPSLAPLPVTYTDGAVNLNPGIPTNPHAKLDTISAMTGGIALMPIRFSNFGNVSAITQKIQYDATQLSFIGLTTAGSFSSVVPNYYAVNGVVTITWTNTNPLGMPINWADGHKLILKFIYSGATSTNLVFYPGCEISNTDGSNVQMVYQSPGRINLITPTAFASFGTPIGTVQQGLEFNLPLLLDLKSTNATAAFTLNILYNNSKLSYIGLVSTPPNVSVNVTGSTIQIVYVNQTSPSPDINGEFVRLRFLYNGVGNTSVDFGPGCLFSRLDGSTIQVGYTPITITPALASVNAVIGNDKFGVYPDVVKVPVYFTGLPVTAAMGAVTLHIGYDQNKLDYIGIEDNLLPGISANLSGNEIIIAWNTINPSGVSIESSALIPFLNLKFQIKAGICCANITFNDGCELFNFGNAIVPANYHNGGVNVKWAISGHLEYNTSLLPVPSAPHTPIPAATIYVKDGPEPVPPATTPVPNIIATTTTDATGAYSVVVPNGSYYLYASYSSPWLGVGPPDVINLKRYNGDLTNTISWPVADNKNPLRLRAADINQDGIISTGDVLPLNRRIAGFPAIDNPNYKITDWLFQNPIVIISCSDYTGTDFLGICSGDVNGSYPDPNVK